MSAVTSPNPTFDYDPLLARTDDPVNAAILTVSEDRIQGFQTDPFGEIARLSEVPVETVMERIRLLLRAGTIRRVRQTLLATNLAQGSLVAWQVPQDRLDSAFEYLYRDDPFSGHVVLRSTDSETAGSKYRLWTTLKVPQGYSLTKHGEFLAKKIGAQSFRLMPAKRLFALDSKAKQIRFAGFAAAVTAKISDLSRAGDIRAAGGVQAALATV
ncbi:MAG: hypothetical protein V4671_04450, partial [Armatimonadota bacterium]